MTFHAFCHEIRHFLRKPGGCMSKVIIFAVAKGAKISPVCVVRRMFCGFEAYPKYFSSLA